ncbi:hypothetical protein MNB_SV-14-134 [hydrothermal vent metagenome]|uniref:Uncharacterized protein n=1 Tax=hydrothermal vent metagenome TaxID=652676 RepID=A0A1W1CMY9_9ZZZZ
MRRVLMVSAILFLIGCSSTKIALGDYKLVPIKKSTNIPSKDVMESKSMKIVVLNIDDHLNQTSKEANLGYAMSSELSSELVKTKRVEVLKRLDKPVFLKELQQVELAQKYAVDIENTNYLLTGEITDAKFINRFHPSSKRTQGGHTPSWVAYRGCIKGTINLFQLPSMQIQEVFPFEECSQDREPVLNPRDMKKKSPELIRKSIAEILEDIVPQMNRYFKPKGYIYAMRSNGKKKIIQTTLTRTLGAIRGSEVDIVKVEKQKNPITKKEESIEIMIGRGTISDYITDEYSFVIIDELKGDIHIGDMVKVVD